jgi:nudix-type nucleoside diphosphatase (YffH/AdpP family)
MPKIAISYRRTDSDVTGRIFDRLVQRYGRNSIFRDIDDIPFGIDFRKVVNDALQGTDALIAIVGPNWRGARTFGAARINEANDPVRIEVEAAIQRDIPLIPVLIGGAVMPKPTELPNTLRDFAFRNAANVDSGRNFETDVERLMSSMDRLFRERGLEIGAEQRQAAPARAKKGPPLLAKRGRADIRSPKRLLDTFFKVDQYEVSYERYDGEMSKYSPRLNFDRGDAVGVLLFNANTRSVVLIEQFKLPTLIGRRRDESATRDGWIVEVMAGMIQRNEAPEETAIRETLEETGYEIETAKLICSFFSSPGGTSERIFLYFATVTDARRPSKDKIGFGDENMRVFELSVNDLFARLEKGEIEDPKLVITAYWLKDNIGHLNQSS